MFKIWLKSVEFEGIKNGHPQRLMTFLKLLLELMINSMFLTRAAVFDDVMDCLQSAHALR